MPTALVCGTTGGSGTPSRGWGEGAASYGHGKCEHRRFPITEHSFASGADSSLWCRGEARPRRLHLIKANPRGRTSTFPHWLPIPYLLLPLKQRARALHLLLGCWGGSSTQRLWVKLLGQQGKAVLLELPWEPLGGLKEKNNPCLLPAALSVSPLPNYYFCSPGASGAADAQKSPECSVHGMLGHDPDTSQLQQCIL